MTQQSIHRAEFKWSEVFVYAAIGLGSLALAISSSAQAVPARFAIGASQVTRAMDAASLPTDGVEVKLAAPVTSSSTNAAVKIESVATVGDHAVRLRLACSDPAQCVPFFAMVTFPDAVDVTKLHGVKVPQVAGRQSSAVANLPDTKLNSIPVSDPSGVRAGASATLALDEDKIHIRLEVICLQGGVVGNRIRVSSLDHKQTYTAEVITPILLKGEFQK